MGGDSPPVKRRRMDTLDVAIALFYGDEDKHFTAQEFLWALKAYRIVTKSEHLPFTIQKPHSYRGHYGQLAFETVQGLQPIEDAIQVVQSAIGKTFHGYKGGTYVMLDDTHVWFARYGDTGVPVTMTTINAMSTIQPAPQPRAKEEKNSE